MGRSQELSEAHEVHKVIHRDTGISVKFIKSPLNSPFEQGTHIPCVEDTKTLKEELIKAPGLISQRPLPPDQLGADVQQKKPLQHHYGCEIPWMPLSHPSYSMIPNLCRAL